MNYGQMKQRVAETLNRSQGLLESDFPTFVRTAENRILLASDLDFFHKGGFGETTAELDIDGDGAVTLPDDYLSSLEVSFRADAAEGQPLNTERFLNKMQPSGLRQAYGVSEDEPRVYAIIDAQRMVIGPKPNAAGKVVLYYRGTPESLAPDVGQEADLTKTTWLSRNATSLLMYAILMEAAEFLDDSSMKMGFMQQYHEALNNVRTEGERKARRDLQDMQSRPNTNLPE